MPIRRRPLSISGGSCANGTRDPLGDELLRYFFDEHVDHAIAEALRKRGIDVLTANEAGRAGHKVPDAEQLAFANEQGRVLVSRDYDYVELAHSHSPNCGVILLQRRLSIGEYVDYLEYTAHTLDADEARDTATFCDW